MANPNYNYIFIYYLQSECTVVIELSYKLDLNEN
jgi:hypothetical protein